MTQFLLLTSLLVIAAFRNRFVVIHRLPQDINATHITFHSFLSFFSEQGLDFITWLQFSVWRHVFQNLASSPDIYQQEIKTKGRT